jgi:hypothetical protein
VRRDRDPAKRNAKAQRKPMTKPRLIIANDNVISYPLPAA